MKKTTIFIFCIFLAFNFVKLSSLHAACECCEYEIAINVKISCLSKPGHLSSLYAYILEDNGADFKKSEDNNDGTIWRVFQEDDSYVLQSFFDFKNLDSNVFSPPKLILEENSDGTCKIKNYYNRKYLVVDIYGYITTSDDPDMASDFILERIN